MLSNHIIDHMPTIEWLGIYPSYEVVISQIVYMIIVILSMIYEKSKHK